MTEIPLQKAAPVIAFESFLREQWLEHVDAMFFYRGMSAKDLTDPLDPGYDPFAPMREDLGRLIGKLFMLLDAGFAFTVYEDYSGYSFALRDILTWSRGDLANPGLDFTSRQDIAGGYAQNFQGSQLKQNFKYITDHLPEHRDDPVVRQLMTAQDWCLVDAVNRWISQESPDHRIVVIRVRRSNPAFESDRAGCLLRGSFAFFCIQVQRALDEGNLPCTREAVAQLLPDASSHFDIRLGKPLSLCDIEVVEDNNRMEKEEVHDGHPLVR